MTVTAHSITPEFKAQWQTLQLHFEQVKSQSMRDLFANDASRSARFSLDVDGFFLDYSKNIITQETLDHLLKLAELAGLDKKRNALLTGETVNITEQRCALHTALRAPQSASITIDGKNVVPEIQQTLAKMKQLVEQLEAGKVLGFTGKPIKQVLSLGIGGSYLGPKIMSQALKHYQNEMDVHFVANIDGHHIHQVLDKLDPEQTLVITSSKSFSTQETLQNSLVAKQWLRDAGASQDDIGKHFVAVSSNIDAAVQFGIKQENIFPMWDWVGGRYSVWSAIGLPLAIAIGFENFSQMLAGGNAMDDHFATAPLSQNMPVIMALMGVWYINFFGAQSHLLLPYHHDLRGFPAYIQQLDMESNGKTVQQDGNDTFAETGPIIWGGEGTNGQHAFHQLMHQGSPLIPSDFILAIEPTHSSQDLHNALASNCFAQSQALMMGKTLAEAKSELSEKGLDSSEIERLAPHKVMQGNKPSNTLLMNALTPYNLGRLIALYEHKVFCQGVIWNINSFDQWGVELGKTMSTDILNTIEGADNTDTANHQYDSSTTQLIKRFSSPS
ncbi:glucose-6-phosphate isomerase [Flocculibacter collagenilyticus]|uniref:glucose-6-phosphate isomerase n=1 Tax=Flocculibacter collagenilyticus TaxID=2744479 RepID=UPI0018F7C34B|nr:glucose-6-phosphate isomerase [Flocculibacter collagenilyticus]